MVGDIATSECGAMPGTAASDFSSMPTWWVGDLAGECGAETDDGGFCLTGDDSVEGVCFTGEGGVDAVGGSLVTSSLTALCRCFEESLRKDGNGRGAAAKGDGKGRCDPFSPPSGPVVC